MHRKFIIFSILSLGIVLNSNAAINKSVLTRAEEVTRANALNSVKASKWNKTFITDDRSCISAINARVGTIAINDPEHRKKIMLQIEALPVEWKEIIVIKFPYHPRIKQWSERPIEELESDYSTAEIRLHTFPEMVDYVVQKFGQRGVFRDSSGRNNPQFTMVGRIINADTGESVTGQFEYTYFEDASGKKTLYHRFFRPHKITTCKIKARHPNYKTRHKKLDFDRQDPIEEGPAEYYEEYDEESTEAPEDAQ